MGTAEYWKYQPHTIADRDYWTTVSTDPAVKRFIDRIAAAAEKVPRTFAHPRASVFLDAKRNNNRKPLDEYWQTDRLLLSHFLIRRCIAGGIESGNDDEMLDTLWSFLTCPTWSVSAHLEKMDLPFTAEQQLDLAGCEMAGVMAELLQHLGPWIDAQSITLRRSMIYEIDRRILEPFAQKDGPWWADQKQPSWMNWSGVCAGSILAACESLATMGQPRLAARKKALATLNTYLHRGFTPAGECDEGIGYWGYGLGFACVGLSRLSQTDLAGAIDLDRLKLIADYPRRVHLFDDCFFSGNDASSRARAPVYATAWLAGATGSEWLAQWTRADADFSTDARTPDLAARTIESLRRLPAGEQPLPTPPASRFLEDQQVAIFMRDRFCLCFTGGNNAENHNHNDLGHFSVWYDNKPIIPDLGRPTYTSDFFGANRYKYLCASSRGHCCPIINGQEQIPGKAAEGKVVQIDIEKQSCALDLTAAYPAEAKLARWTRMLQRTDNGFQIVDEFCATESVEIENVIWSTVEPRIEGNVIRLGEITLTPDSGTISVELVDPKPHRLQDFQETLYRVSIRVKTEGADPIRCVLRILPTKL